MNNSHMVKMPDLRDLEIPEKQRVIKVTDDTIFKALSDEKRTIADQCDGAKNGDYVLFEAVSGDRKQTVHLELGNKRYPEWNAALKGCKDEDRMTVTINGVNTELRVISVRKIVEYPISDESIASLGINGVESMADYRRMYIKENGSQMAERVFNAILGKLQKNLLEIAEIELDGEDVQYYHEQQRTMIQNLTGDVEQRLMDAYGEKGKYSAEECDRFFYNDNRDVFANYIWSKAHAEGCGRVPNDEEVRQAVQNFSLMFQMTENEVREKNLNDALRSFYFQYGRDVLKEYFLSVVSFEAEGIPAQRLGK